MADLFEISVPGPEWSGAIRVPDPQDFNGVMFQTWRKAFEAWPTKEWMGRTFGYTMAEFIREHGEWDVQRVLFDDEESESGVVRQVDNGRREPLPLDEFLEWKRAPELERMRLVGWLGNRGERYWRTFTNFFG